MQRDDATAEDPVEALLRASRGPVDVAVRSLGEPDDVTLPQRRALVVPAGAPGLHAGDA